MWGCDAPSRNKDKRARSGRENRVSPTGGEATRFDGGGARARA